MPGGLLQNEDFKTEAELLAAGGTKDQLLNDTKVYLNVSGETLDDAIANGMIPRPAVLGAVGAGVVVTTQIDLAAVNTFQHIVVFIEGAAVTITMADIVNGGFAGQRLTLFGTDDINTVTISDGVNGAIVFQENVVAEYIYNGTTFVETGRNQ